MVLSYLSIWVTIISLVKAAGDCNPLTQNSCDPIPGLASSSYSVDFTNQKSLPADWVLADASNVTFSDKGVQFNFNKRKDAPYIWTNFYVAYGKVDVELQVAGGTGVITSAVLFSDDADEIDWEFSGSNFGAGVSSGKAQTNVFAKGITGSYDRGTQQDLSPPPQASFHTYTINWTPDRIDWIIDGVTKYSNTNNGQTTGSYQFPQTPSRLHIGVWDAGDPDTAPGTRNWAGGYTDYTKLPYVAVVKSVKISTPYPCKAWQYPAGFSGSWKDVKCTNQTVTTASSASKTSTAISSTYTAAVYTVVANDNGWGIADKLGCTFDQLSAVNPGVNWNLLVVGQTLNNPNAAGTVTGSSSASTPSGKPPDSNSRKTTSSSGIASGTASSNSSVNSVVPVTTSGLGNSSSGRDPADQITGNSSTGGRSGISPNTSSAGSTTPAITQTPSGGATTATATATTTTASTKKSSSSGTIVTNKATTTSTTTTRSTSSSSGRTSPIKTTYSSSGSGWSNWAGNYAGSKSSGRQNSDGTSWGFWKRMEDKHRKKNNFQFGRFGGGHQHA